MHRAQIGLTIAGDNQGNSFVLDKLSSTKYPLYLILMGLSAQLRLHNIVLSALWRPRDENEEADALTNEQFGAFDPARRVPLVWTDLKFHLLPQMVSKAEALFLHLKQLKAAKSSTPGPNSTPSNSTLHARPKKKRLRTGRLRETDPW
jgi:hypothetical protein